MTLKILFLLFFAVVLTGNLEAQHVIPLYDGVIPNSLPCQMKEIKLNPVDGPCGGFKNISVPSLEIFLPLKEQANGSAVIICPGGGYGLECIEECIPVAEAFVKHGSAAFILKYRLPSDSIMVDKSIGPLQDAQQAIKQIRQRAAEWNIDPAKVGIMGFSAGGHLAATAGTHFGTCLIPGKEKINVRPDFMILICPVISMTDKLMHHGSRENLLGESPTSEIINLFSNELHVSDQTPPAYLAQASDDKSVDVDNSIVFYEALRHHQIPAEMHFYQNGGHRFAFVLPLDEWMQPLFVWVKKVNNLD